ncbi:MAG TPA: hypothetical protein VHY08_22080, partial [Bacillota bacterium]|nr:hypothetical protein [Bacillota bacterium]
MKRLMLFMGLIGLLFIIIGCGDPSTKPYVYDGVEMLLNGSVEVDPIGVWNKFENAGINYGWASVAEAGSNSL